MVGVAWPNPNEYVEAIQYPQQAFADADLRSAKVVTNRLGLPRPISGNFATVFEVETGDCRWAVRCFLREVTNQQQRYAAISDHLKRHPLPFMVHFEYLPEGIRVRGKWFPILKMDWMQGIRLDTYVEQHLNDPHRLRQLGEHWIALTRALRAAEIAHGDLQHGNILVTDRDEIKLIDYDGMIVPDVLGLANNEIGHRHYQHPSRTTDKGIEAGNFRNIDNFSSYVIGLSLLALSVDKSLWDKTKAGEENLLFRDVDFEQPGKSAALDLLRHHSDPRLHAIADMMLEAVSARSYLDVPPFERNPVDTRLTQVRGWLLSRVTGFPPTSAPAPAEASDAARTSWIYDHLDQPPLDFNDDFIQHERYSVEAEFQRSVFHNFNFLFPLFALVLFVWRYAGYPQVSEKANLGRAHRGLQQQLVEAKSRRKALSREIVEADRRYQQEVRALEVTITQLGGELELSRQQEARETMRLEHALRSTTYELSGQRLEAGRISGIDDLRIAALARAGIRTAADLTSANEATALHALEHALNGVDHASPRGDWDRLLQWRRQQVSPITPEDVENVHRRYAENQRSLERQQQNAENQLAEVQANSADLELTRTLHDELTAVEAEVNALQRQQLQAAHELSRYELITLKRFLWKMVALPPL